MLHLCCNKKSGCLVYWLYWLVANGKSKKKKSTVPERCQNFRYIWTLVIFLPVLFQWTAAHPSQTFPLAPKQKASTHTPSTHKGKPYWWPLNPSHPSMPCTTLSPLRQSCCTTTSLIARSFLRLQACFPFQACFRSSHGPLRWTWGSRCSCTDLPPHEIGFGGIWIKCSLSLCLSFLSPSIIPSVSDCFRVKIDSPSPSWTFLHVPGLHAKRTMHTTLSLQRSPELTEHCCCLSQSLFNEKILIIATIHNQGCCLGWLAVVCGFYYFFCINHRRQKIKYSV